MKFVALLRGINVGGKNTVDMKRLKMIFESLGFTNVLTYLNSGNVIFEFGKRVDGKKISDKVRQEFGVDIKILIRTADRMKSISDSIPHNWKNGEGWQCMVAYLFDEIDKKQIFDELPVRKEYIDIRYTKGAIYWLVNRENYNKSRINKLIGHKTYQFMTLRNVNTARHLGSIAIRSG